MSDHDEKLRSVADSWIVVTTVFLALQLSIATFTLSYFSNKKDLLPLYLFSTTFEILPMVLALGAFLAIKDPRLRKYSLSALVDRGVFAVFVSTFLSFMTLGVGIYAISENLFFSAFVSVSLMGVSSFMYWYYKKIFCGKSVD